MKLPPLIYKAIGKFVLFAVLMMVGTVMVLNNGLVQKYRILEAIRSFQSFFWERNTAIKSYYRLKEINAAVSEQNAELLRRNVLYKNFIQDHLKIADFDKAIEKIKEEETVNLAAADSAASISSDAVKDAELFDFKLAKVIKNSFNSQHNYIIIDKGSRDGIMEDMGVITPWGAIGIVRAVSQDYSYVLSFLNEKQVVSAKVGKSSTFGTLKWTGKATDKALLTEIPQHIKVRAGDTIYTSGYSSFFPANIPIATAISYKIVNGTHKSIKVKLLQNFKDLDYVIVAKHVHRGEIDSLSNIKPTVSSR